MFSNIVIGANGRPGDQDAAALAKLLADPDARLVFTHVGLTDLPPTPYVSPSFYRAQSAWAAELVERQRRLWGDTAEACMTAAPSVGEGLERVAADREADLIVVGACEHGAIGRVLVGDDAASVLHRAKRTVAIAPRGYSSGQHTISTIGVAFDGSPGSEAARSLAAELSDELHARLLTRCISAPHVFASGIGAGASYMEDPEDLRARTQAELGELADSTEILIGSVEPMLGQFSREVDLLVCGSRHNDLVRRVALGTTSGYLAHHSRCPLLVSGSRSLSGRPLANTQASRGRADRRPQSPPGRRGQ